MIIISCNFNILYIIIFNFHQINFNTVTQWYQFYIKVLYVIQDLVGDNNNSTAGDNNNTIANCIFYLTKKK